ncbi:MAG: DUF2807 domain-containing protein [Bacteroidales bacterium]
MNTNNFKTIFISVAFFISGMALFGQEPGNKKVTTEARDLTNFNALNVGGALNVFFEISDGYSVKIETDENLQDNVKAEVIDAVLYVKSNTMKNPTKLNAYISMPELIYLNASGATEVKGNSLVVNDEFKLTASGASSVSLDLDVQYLETSVAGAADVTLAGIAKTHKLDLSGAGSLKAKGLVSSKAIYNVSGASDAAINVTDEVVGEKKGVASVSIIGEPTKSIISSGKKDDEVTYKAYSNNYYDSVKVKVGKIKVEVYEGDDSVRVIVGDRKLTVDDDGNVRFSRCKVPKFNGHWAGFEMGINGYVNSDFNQSFPKEYEYLDLRMTKSIAVYINFFEQNIAFSKNQKWGMVTGLGLEWHNYRFSRDTRLVTDSSYLVGLVDQDISIRKNKLVTLHLNVPVLFEFQTNSRHKKNSFHVATGMVFGARLSSHTKKYYNELNKDFYVEKYNPATDQYEYAGDITSPGYSKAKEFDDFFLQPFKLMLP